MSVSQNDEFENPLALWLALELRRSRAAFYRSRKEQDADFTARGMPKCGPRVKMTLNSASEICVELADATLAKTLEFSSTPEQIAEAEKAVLEFTREVTNTAVTLAYYVSGETGLGGSVVKAATELGAKLQEDITGAFALAKTANSTHNNSLLDELLSILRDEALHLWKKERERVNSEFAKPVRLQSGYHIKTLIEAAEQVISQMLDRAFAIASPSTDWRALEAFAVSAFEPLAAEIGEIAISKSGRMPQTGEDKFAQKFAIEAMARLSQKIKFWRLGAQIQTVDSRLISKVNKAKGKKAAGRPKGAGAIDDSLHLKEMAQLIEKNPTLTVRDAAKMVEPKAAQPNTDPESTIRRLKQKFDSSSVGK